MRLRVIALTMTAFALVALTRRAEATPQRIAVLGIAPQDDGDAKAQQRTAELAKALTDGLRTRANRGGMFELAPNSAKELTELKLLSDCLDEAPECMATIGRELGADVLLYGHLERNRDGFAVNLTLLDVGGKRVTGAKARNLTGDTDEEGMRKLATVLFSEVTGQPLDTVLVVKSNSPTGTIYVNGSPKGTLAGGTATLRGLPAGEITIAIDQAGGFAKGEKSAVLTPGESTTVSFDLAAREVVAEAPKHDEAPMRPGGSYRILFWSSLVVTAGGVAAFTVTGLRVSGLEDDQAAAIAEWGDAYKSNGVQHPDDACAEAKNDGFTKLADICDDGDGMATLTNVFIGVTAVAAIATGWFYYKGYVAPGSASTERATARAKSRRTVTILPSASPSGAGVGAVIQF